MNKVNKYLATTGLAVLTAASAYALPPDNRRLGSIEENLRANYLLTGTVGISGSVGINAPIYLMSNVTGTIVRAYAVNEGATLSGTTPGLITPTIAGVNLASLTLVIPSGTLVGGLVSATVSATAIGGANQVSQGTVIKITSGGGLVSATNARVYLEVRPSNIPPAR